MMPHPWGGLIAIIGALTVGFGVGFAMGANRLPGPAHNPETQIALLKGCITAQVGDLDRSSSIEIGTNIIRYCQNFAEENSRVYAK